MALHSRLRYFWFISRSSSFWRFMWCRMMGCFSCECLISIIFHSCRLSYFLQKFPEKSKFYTSGLKKISVSAVFILFFSSILMVPLKASGVSILCRYIAFVAAWCAGDLLCSNLKMSNKSATKLEVIAPIRSHHCCKHSLIKDASGQSLSGSDEFDYCLHGLIVFRER